VGHHSSALFVQWVPYQLAGTTWEAEEEKYTQHLLDIVDSFAPGALVVCLWLADMHTTRWTGFIQNFGMMPLHSDGQVPVVYRPIQSANKRGVCMLV
jgi:hypothetical protein